MFLYGAGECCNILMNVLKAERIRIDGIIVDDIDKNPDKIEGISVLWIKDVIPSKEDKVIIALSGRYNIDGVRHSLMRSGYSYQNIYIENYYMQQLSAIYPVEEGTVFSRIIKN